MKHEWTYHFLDSTTFILGNNKNAGKTTFMNLALNQIRELATPAFLSVGIDGEHQDLIDGRSKPQIKTQAKDIVVTTYPMIHKSDGSFKLLKVFPYQTVLGQLVIAETQRSGFIELVGPENNVQLANTIHYLKDELGIQSIVIDGAANRKTPISSIEHAGFFYVIQVTKRTLSKVIENCKLLNKSTSLPVFQASKYDDIYVVEGALTNKKVREIPNEAQHIVIDNMSSVFITYKQLTELCASKNVMVKRQFKLIAFVAVLQDIHTEDFKELFRQNNINAKIIFNPYVN